MRPGPISPSPWWSPCRAKAAPELLDTPIVGRPGKARPAKGRPDTPGPRRISCLIPRSLHQLVPRSVSNRGAQRGGIVRRAHPGQGQARRAFSTPLTAFALGMDWPISLGSYRGMDWVLLSGTGQYPIRIAAPREGEGHRAGSQLPGKARSCSDDNTGQLAPLAPCARRAWWCGPVDNSLNRTTAHRC